MPKKMIELKDKTKHRLKDDFLEPKSKGTYKMKGKSLKEPLLEEILKEKTSDDGVKLN